MSGWQTRLVCTSLHVQENFSLKTQTESDSDQVRDIEETYWGKNFVIVTPTLPEVGTRIVDRDNQGRKNLIIKVIKIFTTSLPTFPILKRWVPCFTNLISEQILPNPSESSLFKTDNWDLVRRYRASRYQRLSLSLQRHPYLFIPPNFRFIRYNKQSHTMCVVVYQYVSVLCEYRVQESSSSPPP